MDPNSIKLISKEYCYQYVCQGDPKWPNKISLPEGLTTDLLKNTVEQECKTMKNLINHRVTLISMSAAPEKVYKCLEYILKQYEQDHDQYHPFDVRRLPLPRLFSILPSPRLHWRSITISVNALSSFVKETLPRGYMNQLLLFNRIINFKVLGYRYEYN